MTMNIRQIESIPDIYRTPQQRKMLLKKKQVLEKYNEVVNDLGEEIRLVANHTVFKKIAKDLGMSTSTVQRYLIAEALV